MNMTIVTGIAFGVVCGLAGAQFTRLMFGKKIRNLMRKIDILKDYRDNLKEGWEKDQIEKERFKWQLFRHIKEKGDLKNDREHFKQVAQNYENQLRKAHKLNRHLEAEIQRMLGQGE